MEVSALMTTTANADLLTGLAESLREQLAPAFSVQTAQPGTQGNTASAGHCAAVAAIVACSLGGQLVSTYVQGASHWFNRFGVGESQIEVDLTGDQFGRSAIQIGNSGELYGTVRVRSFDELNLETLRRARLLAERAGLLDVANFLHKEIFRRETH